MRLIVIGAGPMGLEAALLGVERGFEVTVLEKGQVGDALRRWGATRTFSPFGMNLSRRARALLDDAPPDDALLTGRELAERVLQPLAHAAPLAGRVHLGTRVLAVGRARMTRAELAGHPLRAERPFRVVCETREGERVLEAERVLDASGVYDLPTCVGAGGLPAVGERALAGRLARDLGQLEARLPLCRWRRVQRIGHAHSARQALVRPYA